MPHIRGTNIIVDDFRFSPRSIADEKLIFFLSHFHADHYPGLSSAFRAGPIYCTEQTAEIAANKFPGISPKLVPRKYNETFALTLSEEHKLEAKATFMDANHIVGSAMVLFEGYFGRILYSGDMRYHDKLLAINWPLFRADGALKAPIDELILDNTYCDPIFAFPNQERCVDTLVDIVERCRAECGAALRVFIYAYSIGKEEICVELARRLRTKVVLDAKRFKLLGRLAHGNPLFTQSADDGFLFLARHSDRSEGGDLAPATVHITLTGWVNCPPYVCLRRRHYLVPYSSHSNFQELDRFVALVRPAALSKIVVERRRGFESPNWVKSIEAYFVWLKGTKQRGFSLLCDKYVDRCRASSEYAALFDAERLNALYRKLGVERSVALIAERANDKSERRSSKVTAAKGQTRICFPATNAAKRESFDRGSAASTDGSHYSKKLNE